MNVLTRLSTPELVGLAAALRSGRLSAPFTETALRRFGNAALAKELAAELTRHDAAGLSAAAIGFVVDAALAERNARSATNEVELVWSGPEAPGVANRDTAAVIRELFASATKEVLVAGFAVHQGKAIFQSLADRMAELPDLRVQLYLDVRRPYGDATPSSELAWKFVTRFRTSEWPGTRLPELYHDPRSLEPDAAKRSSLHAKCVVVDRRIALVTSANFTEAAHDRNIEVGSLIRSPAFAEDLARQFETLRAAGLLVELPGMGRKSINDE